jgi:murein tripeptide amidase MpaA
VVDKYLTLGEIDAATDALGAAYPSTCQRFALPNVTLEGRDVNALKIGSGTTAAGPGMLLLGGVHAREWVPPDAIVYWAADILEAHDKGKGLRYGEARFTAADVKAVVEQLGLVLIPCVNPDGREHSQAVFPMWRGNRNVTVQNGRTSYGVDLNRNYDFLWNFRRHFHPSVSPASDNPFNAQQTFCGRGPASEPETRNVVSLYDHFPIQVLVDVHSYVPCVLRSWGSDDNQSHDPAMNFLNPAFDGRRGVPNDNSYREFISASDVSLTTRILADAVDAMERVRGVRYGSDPAAALGATSGAGDDYAYSRHLRPDLAAQKVLGITMECGSDFQPRFPEAAEVMKEVAAGLTVMALSVMRQGAIA